MQKAGGTSSQAGTLRAALLSPVLFHHRQVAQIVLPLWESAALPTVTSGPEAVTQPGSCRRRSSGLLGCLGISDIHQEGVSGAQGGFSHLCTLICSWLGGEEEVGRDSKAAGQGCLAVPEFTGAPVSQDAVTSVCGFNLVREGGGRGGKRGGIPRDRRP